jgi:hypothetical protein
VRGEKRRSRLLVRELLLVMLLSADASFSFNFLLTNVEQRGITNVD